jgi:selenocysteine-specific elongation factor
VAPEDVGAVAGRLVATGRVARADGVLVASAALAALRERLLGELHRFHAAQPLLEGLPREEARERVFGRAHPALFDRVVTDLVAEGVMVARDRLALATHRVSLSAEEEQARLAIERAFRDGGLTPPDPSELVSLARVSADVADRVVRLLLRQKVLVRVETLLFHDEALQRLKGEMRALRTAGGGQARVDVGAFKQRYGVTRKYAIPLLEYLDRERVTRRVGEARVIL